MVFGKDPVRLETAPTVNSDRQSAVSGNSLDGDCNAVGQHACYGAFWQEMRQEKARLGTSPAGEDRRYPVRLGNRTYRVWAWWRD